MKLVALCLLAVCCSVAANKVQNKLREVLNEVTQVRRILEHSNKTLNTPPENIEDCCCQSALTCFRANIEVHLNITEKIRTKLYRSLQNHLTLSSLEFKECHSKNIPQMCHDCDSHPKENVQVFFNSLQTLINRALSKQSMI